MLVSSLALASMSTVALAQSTDEEAEDNSIEVLLEGRGTGGYGGPEFGVGLVGGRLASRFGGRAAWQATRGFAIGAFGESIASNTALSEPVRIVDGGLFIEAAIAPRKPIHVSLEGGAGVGSVSWADESGFGFLPYAALRLDLNVVTWFRASIGPRVGAIASSAVPVENSAVTGGLDVVLKFGAF